MPRNIRGNTDGSWQHGLNCMLRRCLFEEPYGSQIVAGAGIVGRVLMSLSLSAMSGVDLFS
jgi:hypothetical protein